MQDTNTVVLIGRLGKDAELKYIGETALAQFSIAVNTSKKNQAGEYEDKPNWVDVKFWGKAAESVHRYLTKGKQIGVSGRLEQECWQTDAGENRSKIVVVAERVQLLGGTGTTAGTESATETPSASSEEFDDDLPF